MGYIDVNNLSYSLDDSTRIFSELSFSLDKERTGLVGENGVGKTTLLKILVKEISLSNGSLKIGENIAYLPQDFSLNTNKTVNEFLDEPDFKILKKFQLEDVDFNRNISELSGGEKMKIALVKILSSNPEFIILDEPTNNLDAESKEVIYQMIKDWKKGLLIVSHDRELLNLMDRIMELTPQGLKIYGGNFESYQYQKEVEKEALKRQFVSAKQKKEKAEKQAKKTEEKQQKRMKKGITDRQKIGMPKSMLNLMKDTAQATASRLTKTHQKTVASIAKKVEEIKKQISPENEIVIKLPKTYVPKNKMVIKAIGIDFAYGEKKILNDFNLEIYGPERLCLSGKNGSGKTTLAKLLIGQLVPQKGEIKIGVENVVYLDQDTTVLKGEETLLTNMVRLSGLTEGISKEMLVRFLFRGIDVNKKIEILSGGERIRAALACLLSGNKPPQLLILDEPTNNLDMEGIEKLESALNNYEGVLLVISHDKKFLENIGITKEIKL